jgi:hypothetical protein
LLSTTALGAPRADVRNGTRIHIQLAGHREEAVGLRPGADGWRVVVGGGDVRAALFDVTSGRSLAGFELPVQRGKVLLDRARFLADHAYRLELRRGTELLGSALLYLYPPPRGSNKVIFDDGERDSRDDDGILATAKGGL